jgi:hypothetical protein
MGLLDDAIKEHLELKRRRGADAGEISRLESEALGPVRRSADGVPDLSDTVVPEEPAAEEPDMPASAERAPWEDEQTAVRSPLPGALAHEPPPVPPSSAAAPPTPAYEPVSPKPMYESPPVTPPPTREAWMTDPDPPEPEPAVEAEPEPEPAPTGLLSRLRVGRRHKPEPEPEPEAQPKRPAADDSPPVTETRAYEPPPPPSHEPSPPPVQHEPDIVPADDEPDVEELLEETPEFLEETPEHDRLWFEQRPPRDFDFDG